MLNSYQAYVNMFNSRIDQGSILYMVCSFFDNRHILKLLDSTGMCWVVGVGGGRFGLGWYAPCDLLQCFALLAGGNPAPCLRTHEKLKDNNPNIIRMRKMFFCQNKPYIIHTRKILSFFDGGS